MVSEQAAPGGEVTLSSIVQARIPTLQHVPKGARDFWARVFNESLSSNIQDPEDLPGWTRLFMLSKCVLANPANGHKLRWQDILQLVKSRLRRWLSGDLASLWSETLACIPSQPSRRKDNIAAALNIIESDGPPVGLNLNRAKSLLFIPEDVDASCSPLPPEIPITQRGFTLLGFPIGPASFCEEVFLSRVAKVKTSIGFLQDMDDSQMETALLRSCLAFPKVVFPLRTCPPHYIHHALEEFDNSI